MEVKSNEEIVGSRRVFLGQLLHIRLFEERKEKLEEFLTPRHDSFVLLLEKSEEKREELGFADFDDVLLGLVVEKLKEDLQQLLLHLLGLLQKTLGIEGNFLHLNLLEVDSKGV